MLNKLLFISSCGFSPLLAAIPEAQEQLQIGRYQMVGINTGTSIQLYLLDTATGNLWKSAKENNWVDHDIWKLQIATPPVQPR